MNNNKTQLNKYARSLRNNMTKAEKRLWYDILSMKKFRGLKFNRQKVIDQFIVDFYCHELSLIIEVDGKSHDFDDAQLLDQKREDHLKGQGYFVIRFSDYEVLNKPEVVLEVLNIEYHLILKVSNFFTL